MSSSYGIYERIVLRVGSRYAGAFVFTLLFFFIPRLLSIFKAGVQMPRDCCGAMLFYTKTIELRGLENSSQIRFNCRSTYYDDKKNNKNATWEDQKRNVLILCFLEVFSFHFFLGKVVHVVRIIIGVNCQLIQVYGR